MNRLQALAVAGLLLFSLSTLAESNPEPLFQNRFFTLSQNAELLCATSEQQFTPSEQLAEIIRFYEKDHPNLRQQAVAVLTEHTNPEHLEDLADFRDDCRDSASVDLCVLEKYWDDKDAAWRALALFYDSKTVIKHSEDYRYQVKRFDADHLRIFEKAIRKIPAFLRESISKAKPTDKLEQEIADKPTVMQELIRDAFPEDYKISIWQDYTHPLTLVPGVGFRSQTVAQVFSGQNLIVFTVKEFDKAKEESTYRDIEVQYLVDFRLPIVVHEIAHTIDNFHFWNGEDDLYFFYKYHKISNDEQIMKIIAEAKLALWPSKWFEAFEFLAEVNEGRYDGNTQEKLAELVAQYILIPERLRQSAPAAYQWLRNEVFRGIEYQGYDRCPTPITRPLTWWQKHASGKLLGH
ncbi:hypothetical protein IVG45_16770 [Methylomonas sp. LL1]|uniref:hypothetical protein n=1 Tax=Methylomonas sp. LL1 TaxID=2785785 RepID=UPI0018C40BBE|nr:hypothetical protein [Methylomonas sp. LL1]QPK62491.1 hypothetical protein IVG45_16770 [Methylomonas sp. LL1]